MAAERPAINKALAANPPRRKFRRSVSKRDPLFIAHQITVVSHQNGAKTYLLFILPIYYGIISRFRRAQNGRLWVPTLPKLTDLRQGVCEDGILMATKIPGSRPGSKIKSYSPRNLVSAPVSETRLRL